MSNLPEQPAWESGIHQLEESERAKAGPGGILNLQASQLANRTNWLRILVESASDYREYTFYKTLSDPDGTITGLANTPIGKIFRVAEGVGSSLSFNYYLNADGVAFNIASMPGMGSITNNVRFYTTLPEAQNDVLVGNILNDSKCWVMDGELADEYINSGGTLEATGRVMISQGYVDERIPDLSSISRKVPIILDATARGGVIAWAEDGYWNSAPLHPDLTDPIVAESRDGLATQETIDKNLQDIPTSSKKMPLILDNASPQRVALWSENGFLNGIPLHSDLTAPIVAEVLDKIPPHMIGQTLWRFRAKKANLDSGISTKLKIGFAGDSWTEKMAIPKVFLNYFKSKYGKAGDGWIQLNIDGNNLLDGVSLSRTGWTVYDASTTTAAPTFPTPMDGQYIYATGTAATLTLSNVFATSIRIFYYDGIGAFRYSVNGGLAVFVSAGGTNVIKSVLISGLTIGSAANLAIDLTGNAGTVVLYGFYVEGSGNGVEIDKMGNGGITAERYTKTLPYLAQTAAFVDPDLLVLIIGTNDFRTNVSLSGFRTTLTTWIQSWQTACPDTGIILVTPPQCNAIGDNPLSDFRDIMQRVAQELGIEYFSMFDYLDVPYAKSNAQGLWADSLHLNDIGARFLMNQINSHFLEV
ncbi:SGNH/GDSL hydrolase family protein [Klebsiella quasipneumoniae]|uniref:SGNH/GDSL hydrolase family protein n=1 Tax=Klebsiella quasipneumoniae TaxID=1463165 RepID=UPI00237D05B6|nr:GDSL-type esterase/lipase family protein [Klebsiella quasipneumoniae]MDE1598595.1 GDSL-type esterase/lipase family protein [Klebsiella quasipneumoniae]MDE1603889.1 GDSL-type esterase/lipase family protein [Klebsiella quasipneumoniae]MDE1609249.1 GDSL-type esterase/lipase family protein [Klebsiella quasipneumoniae]MDE1614655.1 GDSL-type esterase/lipase family protein [Klebsiella quasipneumoniae]MDE1635607.1 GDSL-type esterase/lipase family protein [Klebsiella quasipneumoniae]